MDTRFKIFHRPTDTWYWIDLMWGNRHATGGGWLCVLPMGEELIHRAFHGDNRILIEPEDCDFYPYLEKIESY